MRGYVSSLIILSCVSSFLLPLLKQGSKLKQYVAAAVGTVCIYGVIFPFVTFLRSFSVDFGDFNHYETSLDTSYSVELQEWILSETDAELKRSIVETIKSRFDISVSTESIDLIYDTSDYTSVGILKLEIDLSDRAVISNVSEMKHYFSDMLCCDCEVKFN